MHELKEFEDFIYYKKGIIILSIKNLVMVPLGGYYRLLFSLDKDRNLKWFESEENLFYHSIPFLGDLYNGFPLYKELTYNNIVITESFTPYEIEKIIDEQKFNKNFNEKLNE